MTEKEARKFRWKERAKTIVAIAICYLIGNLGTRGIVYLNKLDAARIAYNKSHYKAWVGCHNCDRWHREDCPKGVSVEDYLENRICGDCGLGTLVSKK